MKKNKTLLAVSMVAVLLSFNTWAGDRGGDHHRSYKKEHHHSSSCGHDAYRERMSRYSPSVNRLARGSYYYSPRHPHFHENQRHGKYAHKQVNKHYDKHHYQNHYSDQHYDDYDKNDAYKWLAGGIIISEVIHHSWQ